MAKKKILFVSQEVTPYVPAGEISEFCKALPHYMHANGYEARIFMPDYGAINERRNQLHEVIRLSGINIPIADADHPLIVKVASLPPARLQVYFIDSDDYFQKSPDDVDAVGSNRNDNDERMIFFGHGTMETVKKLQWEPVAVICTGWITSLTTAYLKRMFDQTATEPVKIIYVVAPGEVNAPIDPKIVSKLSDDGIRMRLREITGEDGIPDTATLHKYAMQNSDAVAFMTKELEETYLPYAKRRRLPVLHAKDISDSFEAYHAFVEKLTARKRTVK